MKYVATINDRAYVVEIGPDGRVWLDGEERRVDFQALGEETSYSLLIDNDSFEGLVQEHRGRYQVLMRGALYQVHIMDEREQRLAKASSGFSPAAGEVAIQSPMPGLIVAVPVEAGQEVEAGQTLVILESMKMENELKAPRAGKVQAVHVKAGDSVEQNKTLVTMA